MVTTNDDGILRRVLMYNDVVGGQRNKIPDDEILPGINFRMSELQGAVALVQLGRLDDLLRDMRRRKAEIKDGIAGVARQQGVEFRRINDPDGDAAHLAHLLRSHPRASHLHRRGPRGRRGGRLRALPPR